MKDSLGIKIFYAINYLVLSALAITCILPLINVLAISLSGYRAIVSGEVTLLPVDITISTYETMIKGTRVLQGLLNSTKITLVGTVLCMVFTILAAYPLSQRHFVGRKYFTLAVIFTMLFNGGIIPNYLLIKYLGFMNHYSALWIPALVSVYNMLIMRTYFSGLPDELSEAARMDGCGDWRLLLQIILPLSKPVLATIALFYAVGYWNSFYAVMLYISSADKQNLAVVVYQLVTSQNLISSQMAAEIASEVNNQMTEEGVRAASVMVMMIPMLVVYPFLQKYFVKGVMLGAVKG